MTTFIVEPGTFADLTRDQRIAITRIVRLATAKTLNAHAMVPNTKKGIEAKVLLIDANEMLMDLHTAVMEGEREFVVEDQTYRVDIVTEQGTTYASVVRWSDKSGAWVMQFSLALDEGESPAEAIERAQATVRVNHDRNARPGQYQQV